MLWVDHGMDPAAAIAAPPGVFDRALVRIADQVAASKKQNQARDDQAAFDRMHAQLKAGG